MGLTGFQGAEKGLDCVRLEEAKSRPTKHGGG